MIENAHYDLILVERSNEPVYVADVSRQEPFRLRICVWHPDIDGYRFLLSNKLKRGEHDAFNYNAGRMFDLQENLSRLAVYDLMLNEIEGNKKVRIGILAVILLEVCMCFIFPAPAIIVLSLVLAVALRILIVQERSSKGFRNCFKYFTSSYEARKQEYVKNMKQTVPACCNEEHL